MAEIKIYGATQNALINRALATTYTELRNFQVAKNKEFENFLNEILNVNNNFFLSAGAVGADFLTSIVGGIVNAGFDFVSGTEAIITKGIYDLQNGTEASTWDDNVIGRVGYALGNAFLTTTEGTIGFLGGLYGGTENLVLQFGRLVMPGVMENLDKTLNPLGVDDGRSQFVGSWFSKDGGADTIAAWFNRQRAGLNTGTLDETLFDNTKISTEEQMENEEIINANFSDSFVNSLVQSANKTSARRAVVDKMFQNKYVSDLIASGGAWGRVAEFTRGVGSSVGRIIPSILLAKFGGMAAKGLKLNAVQSAALQKGIKFVGSSYFAGSIFGMAMEEALKNGTSINDAFTYATGSALSEMAIENLSGVVLGEALNVKTFSALLKQMRDEGVEEFIAEFGSLGMARYNQYSDGTIDEKTGKKGDIRNETSADYFSRLFMSTLAGAASGGIFGGVSLVGSKITPTGRVQTTSETLSQNINEMGAEKFAKLSSTRIQRTLKDLNSQKTGFGSLTNEQKMKLYKESPTLKRVITEKVEMGVPTYELSEAGRRIVEQQDVSAFQGTKTINKENYAVSSEMYLESLPEEITMENEPGKKIKIKINILENKKLNTLPEDVRKKAKDVIGKFDNVVLVDQADTDFNAFTDTESGIIYLNVNSEKGFTSLYAHEVHDYLTELKAKGKLNKEAAAALTKFQKQFYSKETLDAFKNTLPEKYQKILEFVTRNYNEKDVAREFISKVIEDVMFDASSESSSLTNLVDTLKKVNNPSIFNFLKSMSNDFITNLLGKNFKNKTKDFSQILDNLKENFANAIRLAEQELKAKETIRLVFASNGVNLFSLSEEEGLELFESNFIKKIKKDVELQNAYSNFVESVISDTNEDSPLFFSKILERSFSSLDIKTGSLISKTKDYEVFDIGSKERNAGYLFKAKGLYYNKNRLQDLVNRKDKSVVYNNLSFDIQTNTMQIDVMIKSDEFFAQIANPGKPMVQFAKTIAIGGDIVNENMQVVMREPLIATAALNYSAFENFINVQSTLPIQSFSINNFGFSFSPVSFFSQIQTDDSKNSFIDDMPIGVDKKDAFLPFVILKQNSLSKADTIVGKTDIFSPTRRFDKKFNEGYYTILFNQSGEKTKVKEGNFNVTVTADILDEFKAFKLSIDYIAQARPMFDLAEVQEQASGKPLEAFDPEVDVERLPAAATSVKKEATQAEMRRIMTSPNALANMLNFVSISERLAKIRQNPSKLKQEILSANYLHGLRDINETIEAIAQIGSVIGNYLKTDRLNFQEFRVIAQTYIEQSIAEGTHAKVKDVLQDKVNKNKNVFERVMDINEEIGIHFATISDLYRMMSFETTRITEGQTQVEANNIAAIVLVRSQKAPINNETYTKALDLKRTNNIEIFELVQQDMYDNLIGGYKGDNINFDAVNKFLQNNAIEKFNNSEENEILFSKSESKENIGKRVDSLNSIDIFKWQNEKMPFVDFVMNSKKIFDMFETEMFGKFIGSRLDFSSQQRGEVSLQASEKVKDFFFGVVSNAALNNPEMFGMVSKQEVFEASEMGISSLKKAYEFMVAVDTFLSIEFNDNLRLLSNKLLSGKFISSEAFENNVRDIFKENAVVLDEQGLSLADTFFGSTISRVNSLKMLSKIYESYIGTVGYGFFDYEGYLSSKKNTYAYLKNIYPKGVESLADLFKVYQSKYSQGKQDTVKGTYILNQFDQQELKSKLQEKIMDEGQTLFDKKSLPPKTDNVFSTSVQESLISNGYDVFLKVPSQKENKSYGFAFSSRDFEVDEYQMITNISLNQNNGLVPFFNFNIVQLDPSSQIGSYLTNRIVSGTLITPNGKIIKNPMKIEIGIGMTGASVIANGQNLISQSAAISPLASEVGNIDEYSKGIRLSNGDYVKISLIINPNALEQRKNVIQPIDWYTPILATNEEGYSLTSAKATPIVYKTQSSIKETIFLSKNPTPSEIMRANVNLAAKSLTDILITENYIETEDWFVDKENASLLLNVNALTDTLKIIVSVGQNTEAKQQTVSQVKARINESISMENSTKYMDLAETMFNEIAQIYENIKKEDNQISQDKIIMFVSRAINDFYEENRGNLVPTYRSYTEMNPLATFKQIKTNYESELKLIASKLNKLPFRMRNTNEVKFSEIRPEDIGLVNINVFSVNNDLKTVLKNPEIEPLLKSFREKNIKVNVINQSKFVQKEIETTASVRQTIESDISQPYLQGEKESLASLFSAASKVENTDYSYQVSNQSINKKLIQENEDLVFSKSEKIKATRKKKIKQNLDSNFNLATLVKDVEAPIVPKEFQETKKEKAEIKKTRTKVSKINFNTEYGKFEKKEGLYKTLTKVTKQLRSFLDAQRQFKDLFPQESDVFNNAIISLNTMKAKLENLLGFKSPVTPYDPNLTNDLFSNPLITAERLDIFKSDVLDFTQKELQTAGLIESMEKEIGAALREYKKEADSINQNESNKEEGVSVSPIEVALEPEVYEDLKNQNHFKVMLSLMKSYLYLQSLESDYTIKQKGLTSNIITLKDVVIRQMAALINRTNLPIRDPFAFVNTAEYKEIKMSISDSQKNAIEKSLFDMTSLAAEKSFDVYSQGKNSFINSLESIQNTTMKTAEEGKVSFDLEVEKARVAEEGADVIKMVTRTANERELAYFWYLISSKKEKELEKLIRESVDDNEVKVLRKAKVEPSLQMREAKKKRVEVSASNLKANSKILKEVLKNREVKTFEQFVANYKQKFIVETPEKTAKEIREEAQKETKKTEYSSTYAGPEYVTIQDMRFSPGLDTPLGRVVFGKVKALSKKGKVYLKEGIEITFVKTGEKKYFFKLLTAQNWLNKKINQYIVLNNMADFYEARKKPIVEKEEISPEAIGEKISIKDSIQEDTFVSPEAQDGMPEAPPAPSSPSLIWVPKQDINFVVNGVPQTFTVAQAKEMRKRNQWNFTSEQDFIDYQSRVIEVVQENTQQKTLEAQQEEALKLKPTTNPSIKPTNATTNPATVRSSPNFFRKMVNIALSNPKDAYKSNERKFAKVKDKVVERLSKTKNRAEGAVFGVYQRLEQMIRGYSTSNRMYNHMSSAVSKTILLRLAEIFKPALNTKTNAVVVPSKTQLDILANDVIATMFGTLEYIDENLRVKINVSETNPNGFLFTKHPYWYLREMLKVENWDKQTSEKFSNDTSGASIRRLINAILNYNQKGFGIKELTGAIEEFDLGMAVQPVTDLALKEDGEARTIETTARQWVNNIAENKEIEETAGIDGKPNGISLFDPYTVAEIVSNFDSQSWGMILLNKIIQGQDRAFTIQRAFETIFSEDWQRKNNKNLLNLEKQKVSVVNLGNVQVPMSQIVFLRDMIFREVFRNRAIELGIIDGDKTTHFENGHKVDILAITEVKEKKQRLKNVAKVTDTLALLNELDTIINNDAFAKSYNEKVYQFINEMYPFVNERFKEKQGANLVNDGQAILEALPKLSKQQTQKLQAVLPQGMSIQQASESLYVPFLLSSGSYFKSEKINFSDVLDMGVFDGMTKNVTDSDGIVSVESITNVIESYRQEVSTYYGYHRLMTDLNDLTKYRLEDEETGQTIFLDRLLPKWAIEYFTRLIMDAAGYTQNVVDDSIIKTLLPKIRRNFYTAALGLNVKVIFTQFATLINLWHIYGESKADFLVKMTANLAKRATKTNKAKIEQLLQSNNFYWDRSSGGTFELGEATKEGAKAKTVINTLREFSMKGITLTDNMINEAFYLTLLETINPKTNQTYTPAEASKTLTLGLLRSQSSKQAVAKASLLRSRSELTRIFTKFLGEPMKQITQLASSAFNIKVIEKVKKARTKIIQNLDGAVAVEQQKLAEQKKSLEQIQKLENTTTFATESESYQQKVRDEIDREERKVQEAEARVRNAEQRRDGAVKRVDRIIASEGAVKRLAKGRIAGVLSVVTFLSFLGLAFDGIRGRLAEEKDPEEEMWAFLIKRLGGNFIDEVVGMVPFARDVYSSVVKGYDFGTIGELRGVNSLVSSLNGVFRAFGEGENINWNRVIYNTAMGVSSLFGIPLKPIENAITTPLQYIDGPAFYNYKNLIGSPDRDNIELAEAIKNEDLRMISAIVDRKIEKRDIKIHVDVRNEIKRLTSKGFSVQITGIPDKLVENNLERKLTAEEKKEFAEVYNKADFIVRKLFQSPSYKRLTDKYKARLVQAVYNYYYRYAKQDVLGIDTLSEELTFVSLNEAYRYFLGRAESFRKTQVKDKDRNQPTMLLN
jgi:hypothetical protein